MSIVLIQFKKSWNNIASNPRKISLDNAMRAWCEELDIEEKLKCEAVIIIDNIYKWLNDSSNDPNDPSVENTSFQIYQELLFKTNSRLLIPGVADFAQKLLEQIKEKDFKKNCKYSLKEMENKTMNKLVALVAFVLVGVGVGIYLLNQNQASSNRRSTNPTNPSSPSPLRKAEEKVLVLVVNAQSEKVLQSLKESKRVTSDDCESLYRDTKWLWMGNRNKFEESGLESSFKDSKVSEESESDVYLVQINLNESERGFEQNVVNRLPAFRRLPEIAGEVEVSARLPRKASQNTYLYC